MKKFLLIIGAAIMLASNLSAQSLPETELPEGVTVEPAPGMVDTSENAYPLGVSSIGINFGGKEIKKNTLNTEPALLYRDDFNTPLSSTLTTSIDMMNHKTAGVIFKNTYNQDGIYKVVIPEGMFLYDDTSEVADSPCPGMTIYYKILKGWVSYPADNAVVGDLEEIILDFPQASEVMIRGTFKPSFAAMPAGEDLGMVWSVEGTKLIGKFDQDGIGYTLNTPGKYLLHVLAGTIRYIIDGVTYTNQEIRLTYNIPSSPEPGIWPSCEDVVENGFEYFNLFVPDGWSIMMMNDEARNKIYMVDEKGNVDTSTVIAVAQLINAESTEDTLYLGLFDPKTYEPLNFEWDKSANEWQKYLWTVKEGSVRPWKPELTGKYCLQLVEGLYYGTYQSPIMGSEPFIGNNDPFMYIYDVVGESTAVNSVATSTAEQFDIFNISGVCVVRGGNKSSLKTLPAGLYISNGKKIIVR